MRLFALPETHELGDAIADVATRSLDPLEERNFPGGEFKLRPLVSVRNESVYVVQELHGTASQTPADKLLRLLMFLATCRENGAARVTAIVPYMAFLRKDMQTKPRDPVSSRYMALLFEAVSPDLVVTIEAHNKSAFQNGFRTRTVHLELDHLLAGAIGKAVGPREDRRLVFLAPDSGAVKRADRLAGTFAGLGHDRPGLALMEKHRSEGVVRGELFAGEVDGADVVIVDDMISTGGTIVRAAEAARQRGASRVFAAAAHGLFDDVSERLFDAAIVDRLIVSDTTWPRARLPEAAAARIDFVTCAGLIAETIARLEGGGSIHRLLNPTP